MKTTEKIAKARVTAPRSAGKPPLLDPKELLLPPARQKNLIRWPSEPQLKEVSARLARIAKSGKRAEEQGDYFNSGDLAYQIQQIIQATDELYKKSQRSQR